MAVTYVTPDQFPGSVLTGSGSDTLVLVGLGLFDFAYATVSGFSTLELNSSSVKATRADLSGVTTVFGSGSGGRVELLGADIDLRGITFTGATYLSIGTDRAVVTVDSMSLALRIFAQQGQGETIVLDGPASTPASRQSLFDHGFDRILEGSQAWTDSAPTLRGLGGGPALHVRESDSVRLDPDGNAQIADAEGPVASLDLELSGSGYGYAMMNFRVGPGFVVLNDTYGQTLVYQGAAIAMISQTSTRATLTFNGAAAPEIVNDFVRTLAYAPGDFVYYRDVSVTITARDKGWREASSVIHIEAEPNWTPTKPVLKGGAFFENAVAGTVVGTLSATDANGDPVSYRLTNNASGLFAVEGNKVYYTGKRPLDFESARSHVITAVASDGHKDGLAAKLSIAVRDVPFEFGGVFTGTFGKDAIVGTAGKDKIVGKFGNDILVGGLGPDAFVFDTRLAATNAANKKVNLDRIVDFKPAEDVVHLAKSVFAGIARKGTLDKDAFFVGPSAHDADDRIVYNKATGALLYDPDGNGSHAAVQFATVTKNIALSNLDFFVF